MNKIFPWVLFVLRISLASTHALRLCFYNVIAHENALKNYKYLIYSTILIKGYISWFPTSHIWLSRCGMIYVCFHKVPVMRNFWMTRLCGVGLNLLYGYRTIQLQDINRKILFEYWKIKITTTHTRSNRFKCEKPSLWRLDYWNIQQASTSINQLAIELLRNFNFELYVD